MDFLPCLLFLTRKRQKLIEAQFLAHLFDYKKLWLKASFTFMIVDLHYVLHKSICEKHPLDITYISVSKPVQWAVAGPHTLPADQTIHNRILSKVCCDVFTCGIRNTCNNQHNVLLDRSGPCLIRESHDVS